MHGEADPVSLCDTERLIRKLDVILHLTLDKLDELPNKNVRFFILYLTILMNRHLTIQWRIPGCLDRGRQFGGGGGGARSNGTSVDGYLKKTRLSLSKIGGRASCTPWIRHCKRSKTGVVFTNKPFKNLFTYCIPFIAKNKEIFSFD